MKELIISIQFYFCKLHAAPSGRTCVPRVRIACRAIQNLSVSGLRFIRIFIFEKNGMKESIISIQFYFCKLHAAPSGRTCVPRVRIACRAIQNLSVSGLRLIRIFIFEKNGMKELIISIQFYFCKLHAAPSGRRCVPLVRIACRAIQNLSVSGLRFIRIFMFEKTERKSQLSLFTCAFANACCTFRQNVRTTSTYRLPGDTKLERVRFTLHQNFHV